MLEPRAQQPKRLRHLPVSHLISQCAQSVLSRFAEIKTHTLGLLMCAKREQRRCTDSLRGGRGGKKKIQSPFCTLLCFAFAMLLLWINMPTGTSLVHVHVGVVHVLVRPLALSRGPSPSFLPPLLSILLLLPAVPLLPYISVPERIVPSNTRLHRDAVLSCFISFD